MSYLALPQRFLAQPQGAVELAPRYKDALFFSMLRGLSDPDIARKNKLTSDFFPTPAVRQWGKTLNFNTPGHNLKTATGLGAPTEFTLLVWVRPTSAAAYARILETDYSVGFYLGLGSTGAQYEFITAGDLSTCFGGTVVLGRRDLLIATFSSNTRSLYVNGALVDTATSGGINSSYGTLPLVIGANSGNTSGNNWNGDIDTVGVFPGAFSAAEVKSLYDSPWSLLKAPSRKLFIPAALPNNLTPQNLTQGNSASTGAIGVVGVYFAEPAQQSNTAGTGAITRSQDLTASDAAQSNSASTGSISPYGRLRALLRTLPLNTWVQVNTSNYVDCQMLPADRPVNYPNAVDHVKVVIPWSSIAFDHVRGNLLLWGGGHANYTGNQLYQWHADTGEWSMACLPSRLTADSNMYVVDKKAPQSSHTYQNNFWLENNDMFGTFGGAATPTGGPMLEDNGGTSRRVSPWLYDLTKTDPEKIGGSDGSGQDTSRLGLNAWQHRRDNVTTGAFGTDAYPIDFGGHGQGAAVSISKDGKDYAVFTMDSGSGFPQWCRWEFGNVRLGENDQIINLGRTTASNTVVGEGWMTYDSKRGLVYRNALKNNPAYTQCELVAKRVWVAGVAETPIRLVNASDGTYFNQYTKPELPSECSYGCVYDERNDCLWLWGGLDPDTGVVYRINLPAYDSTTGWSSTTWTVDEIVPAGSRPNGLYQSPVLGKIKHVPELDSFIILDKAGAAGDPDPGVWLFKTAQIQGDLLVANADQSNSVSTGSITVEHTLSAGATAQSNTASSGAITQTHALVTANATQANAASAGAITPADINDLVASLVAQSNVSGTGAITQAHALSGAAATQGNTASSAVISTGDVHNLVASQSTQANIGTGGAITQAHVLVSAPSIQDNIAAASPIVQAHILAALSATQANAASVGPIEQTSGIPPVDAPAGSGPRLRISRERRPAQLS